MKTVTIILCLFILSHSPSFVFADADPANPKKQESPCGFTDDMNCLENGTEADAHVINANFKSLSDKIDSLKKELTTLKNKVIVDSNTENVSIDGNLNVAGTITGKHTQYADCYDQNWYLSFDQEGWSTCNEGYFIVGLYRNTCNQLFCIEYARCCRVK